MSEYTVKAGRKPSSPLHSVQQQTRDQLPRQQQARQQALAVAASAQVLNPTLQGARIQQSMLAAQHAAAMGPCLVCR